MTTYCFVESYCYFVVKETCLWAHAIWCKWKKSVYWNWQNNRINHDNVCLAHCLKLVLWDWCVLVFVNAWFKNFSWMLHKIEKFHAWTREKKIEIKFHKSIILEWKLWSFCRLSTRFGIKNRQWNHDVVVRTSNQQVSSLWKKSAARPGRNLFLGIFLFNGEQWNVRNLIPLYFLVLYW